MLYEVDFAIKIHSCFHTVHTAFVFADSVSECQDKAEQIREDLSQHKTNQVHIFIEA
jgi:hypothetical protein